MRLQKFVGLSLVAALAFVGTSAVADNFIIERRAVFFVLDVSGSMEGHNLRQVRSTLANVVQSLPQRTTYGLVSFAGCSASDVRLEVPLSPGNGQELISKANALRAYGYTDIYGGLMMAQGEIRRLGSDWCVKVMLLSDGEDTCGRGNAVALAKQMAQEGPDCNSITSVSIGVPAWENQVLEEIGKVGKGGHHSVEKIEEIESILDKELEQYLKKKESSGGPGWTGDYSGPGKDSKNRGDSNSDTKGPDSPAEAPEPEQAKNKRKKKND